METNIIFAIIVTLVFLFVQFAIIEKAVQRGIDASETNRLLKEIVKRNEKKDNDNK
jgi:hypothetical protein